MVYRCAHILGVMEIQSWMHVIGLEFEKFTDILKYLYKMLFTLICNYSQKNY